MIKSPSKEEFPNWRIRSFIKWINYQCPRAWQLGCSVAVNKMTMRFKVHHRDKLRIMYKDEGDDFQTDSLCDYGYFYQVYMWNETAPKKYLKQGLSPLHSQKMDLFDSLKDNCRQIGMDNIYNSAAFFRAAYHYDFKVLFHSVASKAG